MGLSQAGVCDSPCVYLQFFRRNTLENIIKKIRADAPKHASVPFWSWNDRLEEGELRRQIKHMHSLGMRGFFMHARGGLETVYMSDEWFDSVRACIDEAQKLGMEAWVYDENGWPSGFAGGELLKEPQNQACGLICEKKCDFPEPSEDILGVYVIFDGQARRVMADDGSGEYTVIRRKRDFSYVDTMNAEVTKKFISLTHERYKREIAPDLFGGVMPGFFCDEPQYFRYGTPWSDTFLRTFPERFGYDLTEKLPALFFDIEGAYEVRYDYHLLCHESFYDGFMKPLYEWCEQNGVKLTGHGIEEWGLGGQMMCCGGIMPFYLYEHVPSIDYLGRAVKDISGAKQMGSVCAQTGKKLAMTETFACCGWDVSPRELKRIVDLQFAGGVNTVCEHLYPYSERGQRKRDFPNHYSEHNTWSEHYADFETYLKNLGSVLSQGVEMADTLVIHPIRSAYGRYKHTISSVGCGIISNDTSGISELEKSYGELVNMLTERHLLYHFGDETVMKELGAYAEGGHIRIGECTYGSVILSCCETLDSNTVNILSKYVRGGGALLVLGDTPTRVEGRECDLGFLKSNTTLSELVGKNAIRVTSDGEDAPIHVQLRKTEEGKLVFLANTSERELADVEVSVAECKGLCEIDPLTLKARAVRGERRTDGSVRVLLDFSDSQSYILYESDGEMLEMNSVEPTHEIVNNMHFTLVERPENMFLLDRARVSFDEGTSYSESRPIEHIRDNLLKDRYAGRLTLRYSFTTEFLADTLYFVAEPTSSMTVSVNGKVCAPLRDAWRFDRSFLVYDISKYSVIGENDIDVSFDYFQNDTVYKVLYGGGNEALRNCLAFDTEIEAAYLYGDFCVRVDERFETVECRYLRCAGGFTLYPQGDGIDISCINADGYPFFAGKMRAKGILAWNEDAPTLLRLCGRYAVVGVRVNGHNIGHGMFTDSFELAPYLVDGENELEIELYFSNRNLLGPHHRHDPEPMFVTPRIMSFEKAWDNGVCHDYNYRYSFVKFGIFDNR